MLCAYLSCCLVFESMEVFGELKTFARFSKQTGQATQGLFLNLFLVLQSRFLPEGSMGAPHRTPRKRLPLGFVFPLGG